MKKGPIGIVAGALALVMFLSYFMLSNSYHNKFVKQSNAVENAWGKVEVAYQRRTDLIPQLVKTVAAVAAQERRVFEEVTRLRSEVGKLGTVDLSDPKQVAAYIGLQNQLSQGATKILGIVEAYPELKSQENFLVLQSQIEGTENRISVERTGYNEAVTTYKNATEGTYWGRKFSAKYNYKASRYGLFKSAVGSDVPPVIDFGVPNE